MPNGMINLGVGPPGNVEHHLLTGLSTAGPAVIPGPGGRGATRYSSRYRLGWKFLFIFFLLYSVS